MPWGGRNSRSVGAAGALGRRCGQSLVHFVQVSLQGLLDAVIEFRELNSHADSRIACPDHAVGLNLFRIDPERHRHFGAQRKRKQGLNITSAPANVSGFGVQVSTAGILKPNGDGEMYLVPCKPSAVLAGWFLFALVS